VGRLEGKGIRERVGNCREPYIYSDFPPGNHFFQAIRLELQWVVLATGIAGLVAFLQPYEQHNSSKNTAKSLDYESSGPSF
jgi:hypothetical protein